MVSTNTAIPCESKHSAVTRLAFRARVHLGAVSGVAVVVPAHHPATGTVKDNAVSIYLCTLRGSRHSFGDSRGTVNVTPGVWSIHIHNSPISQPFPRLAFRTLFNRSPTGTDPDDESTVFLLRGGPDGDCHLVYCGTSIAHIDHI